MTVTRTVRRPRRAVVAMLAVLSVVLSGCGFHGLYTVSLPGGADLGNHPFTVTAHFDDVLDLVPQSAVKVNDVAVGKVTAIVLDGWKAKVTMQVRDSVHLPANARAEVAQTSLLGEKYVSLEQPLQAPSGTLHNNSDIPLSRTRSAPEVEQILGALSLLLNQGGLEQVQVIARELNKAFKGNEGAIRNLLGQLNTFVGTLDSQKTKITTALDSLNTLAGTLNRQKAIITGALDTYPAALNVLANERGKLVTLLSSLSHLGGVATRVINATQTNFVSTLKLLQRPVEQLTAAGSDLPKALRIAATFPFPLGRSREFVRGDYANLAAVLNLNLTDQLCGILGKQFPAICASNPLSGILGGVLGGSGGVGGILGGILPTGALTGSSAGSATSNSASVRQLTPMIIGSGS